MLSSEDFDLYDEARDRQVPVRLWLPAGETRAWIVFSVGFGGDRSGYAYLGRAWAAEGMATAVVEHVGSNLDVLKSLPGESREERNHEVVKRVEDPAELSARPRDLQFVYSHLLPRFAGLPLGLAGHSFGSYTVLASLGLATVPKLPALESSPLEPTSCLVISPQPPGVLFSSRVLGTVAMPTLVLTGTRDVPLSGEGDYTGRRAVFDHLPADMKNLAVLEGVEHMAFANIGLRLGPTVAAVEGLTLAWWETTLWGESDAAVRAEALEKGAGTALGGEYR